MLDQLAIVLFKRIETCLELVRSVRNIFEILVSQQFALHVFITDIDLCVWYILLCTYLFKLTFNSTVRHSFIVILVFGIRFKDETKANIFQSFVQYIFKQLTKIIISNNQNIRLYLSN